MNTESKPNKQINNQSISYQSVKEYQVQDLMNSIQNKLSLLASAQQSIQSISQISPTKPKAHKMNIRQLDTSSHHLSHLKESRVLGRINQMEQYYMQQIKQLNYQIVYLQNQNNQLKEQYNQLQQQHVKLQRIGNQTQGQFNRQLNRKLQQVKEQLISKFANQAQLQYEKHLLQIKQLKQQLNIEKKRRKAVQDQLDLVATEKESLQQFYRELLQNHRKLIQVDIRQTREDMELRQTRGKFETIINTKESRNHNLKTMKRKTQKKQLTREQLIPVLAQGIEQLKAKFKIK